MPSPYLDKLLVALCSLGIHIMNKPCNFSIDVNNGIKLQQP